MATETGNDVDMDYGSEPKISFHTLSPPNPPPDKSTPAEQLLMSLHTQLGHIPINRLQQAA